MLTCIDVKLIFDSVRLGLSSTASILQIADVALRVVFLLFLPCFKLLFRLVPDVVLTLETSESSAIFVFTTKTTQPRPQVFLVNGSLTCRRLHFWRHFLIKHKIRPNLVISNWLWWIKRVLLANQNRGNILNEIIIFFKHYFSTWLSRYSSDLFCTYFS